MTDSQNFVHRGGVLFADGLGNGENTRTGHVLTHGYLNDIADLNIVRGELSVEGTVGSLTYSDDRPEKGGFFSRVFR